MFSPGKLLGLILILLGPFLQAQVLNLQIDVFTHLNTVNDFRIENNHLYAATTGGLVVYDLTSNELDKYTTADGLFDHQITALERDGRGLVILGTLNGFVSFWDESSGIFLNDDNLRNSEIVDLLAIEDTLWVLSDKLVSVYLYNDELERYQFRESYQEFGTEVDKFHHLEYANQRIWVGSNIGLFNAPANFLKYNLYAIDNWQKMTTGDGLPGNNVYSLYFDENLNLLWMATSNGVAKYDFQTFTTFQNGLQTRVVKHLVVQNGNVYVAENNNIFRLQNNTFERLVKIPVAPITALYVDENENVWYGLEKRGLYNFTSGTRLYLDGPLDNYIGEVLKDSQGRIWLTSSLIKVERRQGLYLLTDQGFINYYFFGGNNNIFRAMNNTISVYEDDEGHVWVGSWGGGVIVFDPELQMTPINTHTESQSVWISSLSRDDTLTMSTPAELQSKLSPVPENQYYTVITDILPDPVDRSIWLLDTKPANGNALIHYKNNAFGPLALDASSWEYFPSPNGKINWFEMSWDIFGDLWLVLEAGGLYQVRITNGVMQTELYNENDNLKSNSTLCVAADQDGYVWVGTQMGLSAVLSGQVLDFRENYQPIGLKINDIYVDSRNNKWFATDKGLSVLRASGSPFEPESWMDLIPLNSTLDQDIIATRRNVFFGNLPSEKIHSVYLDESSGDLYLGTDAGLAVIRNNPFASAFENLERVKVGPIPFVVTDGNDNMLNFYNLIPGSEVRILTVNGDLIRVLHPENIEEVRGSQAQWDGRNMEGKLVSSGVYLYLISAGDGQAKTGKILLVRE